METIPDIENHVQRYNKLKEKVGRKNIKLLRNKNILNNDYLSDYQIQTIISGLSVSLELSNANIFRYLSFKVYQLSKNKKINRIEIITEIFNSGVIVIFLIQILIPLCIIVSEFRFLLTPNGVNRVTYRISSFLLSICFMYHIHIELSNEYRESYLLLHTDTNNKEIILIGMMSNFICSLLSIICIPIVINRSGNIIELVFNSTAILFLCQLDESMLKEKYKLEYQYFISKYKIDQFHSYNYNKNCLFYFLYKINFYIFWLTDYFCRFSFFGLPLMLIFYY